MATIETKYLGTLRTEMTHLKSGTVVLTDAPVDNKGKGEAFSPTDLVAAALGSCMLSIMGIVANEHQFSIEGTTATITKIMTSDPRRIAEIVVDLTFQGVFTEKQKKILTLISATCPVALSLHPDVKQTVTLHFDS